MAHAPLLPLSATRLARAVSANASVFCFVLFFPIRYDSYFCYNVVKRIARNIELKPCRHPKRRPYSLLDVTDMSDSAGLPERWQVLILDVLGLCGRGRVTRAQGGPVCGRTRGVARHPLPALKPACGCRALASRGLPGLPAPFTHIALPGPVLRPSFSVMSFVAPSPCRPWRPGVWPPSLLSEHTSGVAFLTTCTCRRLPDWLSSHRLLATSRPPPRGCPQVLCISQIPGANLERRRLSRSWTGGWSCSSPAGQAGASAWAPAGCDFCV